jgi:aspartate-semialdehyde dehydrogenase
MKAPSCKVIDQKKNGGYATPVESAGSFLTYISRIRRDPTKNAVNMWIVSDNLLKGAAFNAVQIAEVLVKKYIRNN